MGLKNVYYSTLKGALTFTGNTLGFSSTPVPNTGIDAFLATNPALSAPGYPTPSTLNWQQNGSTAVLNIPPGSTIEHAELIWGGSAQNFATTLPITTRNTPITFTTPLGVNTISFNPATADESNILNVILLYTRSQDVTSLVKAAGAGTYTVNGVPAVLNPSNGSTATAGWVLAVAYSNPTLPYSNLNIYVGNDAINGSDPPIDVLVSGFGTPVSGAVSSRVLVGAMEGNPNIIGDSMLLGPTVSTLSYLSGPNNPSNNFFDSTINGDNGLIDTSGSFGNLNQVPGSLYPGVRSAWDITNVDGSAAFVNSQTQAVIRLQTNGDTYAVAALGISITVDFTSVSAVKSVDKANAIPGDILTYTLVLKNSGVIDANSVTVTDALPPGTTFVDGSITSTYSYTGTNIETGIMLTTPIAPGDSAIVTFKVRVDSGIPAVNPKVNSANVDFYFVPATGIEPVMGNSTSNTVSTNINIVRDFGDAPDTGAGNGPNNYSTLLANNGPRHILYNNLVLGQFVTSEANAYQNITATGDDLTLLVQDDGPITTVPPIVAGDTTYTLPIKYSNDSGLPARIYGWVDFNRNGIFEIGEANGLNVVPSSNVNPRDVNLTFNIPSGTTFTQGDTTFIRVRITTTELPEQNISKTSEDSRSLGEALNGEVEDYLVNIVVLDVQGTVWYDTNCNGIRDPLEPLASGVAVRLYNINDTSNPVAITTTDVNGNYVFNNLPSGTYYVNITSPSGYNFTTMNVGSNDAVDSDIIVTSGNSVTFTLDGNNINKVIDAGLCKLNKISGQTFYDCDLDGILGDSDKLLCGVTVVLYNSSGVKIGEQVTDCDGYYEFDNLPSGTYTVQVMPVVGLTKSVQVLTNYYGSKPNESTGLFTVTLSNSDYLQGYAGFYGTV